MSPSSLMPAPRGSLVDSAIKLMRAQVESGAWKVGEKIPKEAELAEMLQIGRNTVREAVRVLSHAEMLEVRQGDGTYVRSGVDAGEIMRRFAQASLRDHIEMRAILETEAARLAASRRTEEDLEQLYLLLKARGEHSQKGDLKAFVERDIAFHMGVAHAAHNAVLEELCRYFFAMAGLNAHGVLAEGTLPEPDGDAHGKIVLAIAHRDPDLATAAAREVVMPVIRGLTELIDGKAIA